MFGNLIFFVFNNVVGFFCLFGVFSWVVINLRFYYWDVEMFVGVLEERNFDRLCRLVFFVYIRVCEGIICDL